MKQGLRKGGAGLEAAAIKELDSNPPGRLVSWSSREMSTCKHLRFCAVCCGNGDLGSVGPCVCHSQSIGLSLLRLWLNMILWWGLSVDGKSCRRKEGRCRSSSRRCKQATYLVCTTASGNNASGRLSKFNPEPHCFSISPINAHLHLQPYPSEFTNLRF